MICGTHEPGRVDDDRTVLHRYLQSARDALVWKLDGLDERALRLPRTPTGTNLLGLVKHAAGVEIGYFGETFGRDFPGLADLAWYLDETTPNLDMYATADESVDEIVALYRRVWAFADELVLSAPLDTPGRVAWWPEHRNPVTLQQVVVHVTSDLARHAGHADILRELADGAAGLRVDNSNLPGLTADEWATYVAELRRIADGAGR